ncbi:MAG TPA: helix-turn-helix domain-containing protein [Ktedonobacterales bacterium]|nr:helix-turn-helix domain-containing protein [Ktedonobacterales bacterium]
MAEPVDDEQQKRGVGLYHLTKTDPDPRVRRRAQALLQVEEGHSQASAARLLHTSAYRVHVWQQRFAVEGRAGLVDRPRGGRPHALSATDRAFLEAALDQGPQAYGLPMTIWSIRDLQALLQRERGVVVSVYTVHRAVHDLGFCYRRPRHDLTHRQDAQAVAAAGRVLNWLQKKRLLSPTDPLLREWTAWSDSIWSMWTSAKSTPIPTWQRSGGARGSQ